MTKLGVVVIGRNEGERLQNCLKSVSGRNVVVYVDSGSTDGSAKWARDQQFEVVELDMNLPFTAGRARNAGFRRLKALASDLVYVQFVDGDCELNAVWLERAISFLQSHGDAAVVCGRLKERYADRSVYNWLCDREWDGPIGDIRSCGGIFMARVVAFDEVNGFREDLIAGEEPELCVRLRAARWRIWRLEIDMALHDAAMTRFGQWWRRAMRAGYTYAQGAHLHGATSERYNVWESRRAWLWGILFPLGCVVITLAFPTWGWVAWLIYPLQMLRQARRNPGSLSARAKLAAFQVLARFPEAWGQIKFMSDRLWGRQTQIIEYKWRD